MDTMFVTPKMKPGQLPRGDAHAEADALTREQVVRCDASHGPGEGRTFSPAYMRWLERFVGVA